MHIILIVLLSIYYVLMVMILPLNLHVTCEYRHSYDQFIMTFSLSRKGCCSSGRPFLPRYVWATADFRRHWPGRLCHKVSSVPRFFLKIFPQSSSIFRIPWILYPKETMDHDGSKPFNQKFWKGMMDMSWILTERKSFPFHWKYLYFCSSDAVDYG